MGGVKCLVGGSFVAWMEMYQNTYRVSELHISKREGRH